MEEEPPKDVGRVVSDGRVPECHEPVSGSSTAPQGSIRLWMGHVGTGVGGHPAWWPRGHSRGSQPELAGFRGRAADLM